MNLHTPATDDLPDATPAPDLPDRILCAGVHSARRPAGVLFALGMLAGMWLSFAAGLCVIAGADVRLGFGPAQLLAGLAMSVGPLLVVLAAGELFAVDLFPLLAWLGGRLSFGSVARSALPTWAGNLAAGMGMAALTALSAQHLLGGSAVGNAAVAIGAAKCHLPFGVALLRGVLGGMLVALCGWLLWRARSSGERVLATVLPFTLLTASGLEYAVCGMYQVPLAIVTQGAVGLADPALTWVAFVFSYLLPVTFGNATGALVTSAVLYWAFCLAPQHGARRSRLSDDSDAGTQESEALPRPRRNRRLR